MKTYLGLALLANVVGIVVVIVTGHDVGPLDELAYALAGGLAGVTLPRGA